MNTVRNPKAKFSSLKHFYVEHRLSDDHHVDQIIVNELRGLGRQASAGPLTMMPAGTDAIVTYSDEWAWDFKSYMNYVSIEIRDARTDEAIGRGVSQYAAALTKPPEKMVRELLVPLLK